MSSPVSMRVLDHCVRWSVDEAHGLGDLGAPSGLELASAAPAPFSVHESWLADCLPEPRLAPIGDGGWLLVHDQRVARLAPCAPPTEGFVSIEIGTGRGFPVAVAAGPVGLAILTRDLDGVTLVERRTLRVRRMLALPAPDGDPRLVAVVGRRVLVVTDREVVVLALDGRVIGRHPSTIVQHAERVGALRLAGGPAAPVVAVSVAPGWSQLFRLCGPEVDCLPLDPAEVHCNQSTKASSWPGGFCVHDGDERRCFTDEGRPSEPQRRSPIPRYATEGRLETIAIDGGRDDANWHRIRVDMTTPAGTAVQITAASSPSAKSVPLDEDWTVLPRGTVDGQLRVPSRRHLRLRVTLTGDGAATPVVHRIRVDLDQPSTIDLLPAIYRREPTSTDFTRRLLALFDAELEDADDAIDRTARMLDPATTGIAPRPEASAVWHDSEDVAALAALVGLDVDPSWPVDRVRTLLQRPEILSRQGSASALAELLRLLYDVPVHVEEQWRRRAWGAAGSSKVGQVRLYSRSALAVRLGVSRLGSVPIDSTSVPERSAHSSGAFRAVVHVGVPELSEDIRAGVIRTVANFAPAHIEARVRFAAGAVVLGRSLLVGVDTYVGSPQAVVLRTGASGQSARLGSGVLAQARGAAVTVGRRARVGVDTTV